MDGGTMQHQVNANGSVSFDWELPSGVTNQRYNVRIRSEDGSKEFLRSQNFDDATHFEASAWDLRGLVPGTHYQWFVRAYDPDFMTMAESERFLFYYNPYDWEFGCSCDVNGDGQITPQDALCAFQVYLGMCPTPCGPCDGLCSDVTMDGQTTPADALEIFKGYLGILPNVCAGQ